MGHADQQHSSTSDHLVRACEHAERRSLLRRTALGSAASAAALKPLCSVLRAATAWQQKDLASLLTRRPLVLTKMAPRSSVSTLNRSMHYQVLNHSSICRIICDLVSSIVTSNPQRACSWYRPLHMHNRNRCLPHSGQHYRDDQP